MVEHNQGLCLKSTCPDPARRERENSDIGTPVVGFMRGRRARGPGVVDGLAGRGGEGDSTESLRGQLKNQAKAKTRAKAALTLAEKELKALKEKLKAAEQMENRRQ
jgi:hypothetical protein